MTAPHRFIRSWPLMTARPLLTAHDLSWPPLAAHDRDARDHSWLLMTAPNRSCLLLTASDRSWPLVTAHERWLLTAHPFMLRNAHTHTRTHTHTIHARTYGRAHTQPACTHITTQTHAHTQTQMHIFLFVHVCVCVCVRVCLCVCVWVFRYWNFSQTPN